MGHLRWEPEPLPPSSEFNLKCFDQTIAWTPAQPFGDVCGGGEGDWLSPWPQGPSQGRSTFPSVQGSPERRELVTPTASPSQKHCFNFHSKYQSCPQFFIQDRHWSLCLSTGGKVTGPGAWLALPSSSPSLDLYAARIR